MHRLLENIPNLTTVVLGLCMGADLEEDLKRLEQEQLLGDPAHKALMTTVIQVRRPLIHDSLIIFD